MKYDTIFTKKNKMYTTYGTTYSRKSLIFAGSTCRAKDI